MGVIDILAPCYTTKVSTDVMEVCRVIIYDKKGKICGCENFKTKEEAIEYETRSLKAWKGSTSERYFAYMAEKNFLAANLN